MRKKAQVNLRICILKVRCVREEVQEGVQGSISR
jgi:hypothetical protein